MPSVTSTASIPSPTDLRVVDQVISEFRAPRARSKIIKQNLAVYAGLFVMIVASLWLGRV